MREPHRLIWDDRLEEPDRKAVDELNTSLERLDGIRAVEINVSGPFARSKIAWKLANYQHVLLHRIVALMDGAAVAWNSHCTLSAILTTRALMETLAVMVELDRRVTLLLASEDLAQLDALAQNGIFASRDEELLQQFPETKATNILTYVDKLDKLAAGFRAHYDILSEWCHPNSAGHSFMFSKTDRQSGTIQFLDERDPGRNGQMILAGLALLPLIESIMPSLDNSILKVADLHHRVSPVGGSPSPDRNE